MADAYFLTVFRLMPSIVAIARSVIPRCLASCTASQRACWRGVGRRGAFNRDLTLALFRIACSDKIVSSQGGMGSILKRYSSHWDENIQALMVPPVYLILYPGSSLPVYRPGTAVFRHDIRRSCGRWSPGGVGEYATGTSLCCLWLLYGCGGNKEQLPGQAADQTW